MSVLHDFEWRDISGQSRSLAEYQDKVILIVNVASRCSFTPQYAELEELWQRYKEYGLVVLGFPCNQFRHQEPGDVTEIQRFCAFNYGVSFPLSDKIQVNGPDADPLWVWLASQRPGLLGTRRIKWNFTKFLIDRQGSVIHRYGSATRPKEIAPAIEVLLQR